MIIKQYFGKFSEEMASFSRSADVNVAFKTINTLGQTYT